MSEDVSLCNNRQQEQDNNNMLLLNEARFKFVDRIPPREFHYKIGEKTKELIAVLSGAKPGSTLTFSVSGNLPKREEEKKLRQLRDRLKVAVKHAPGFWELRRRRGVYYVRRAPESEYYENPEREFEGVVDDEDY